MPRTYVKKKVQSYSDASCYRTAAKEHKIPYETLRRWVVKNPSRKGSAKLTVFSSEEENIIVQSLKFMARCGYPQDRKDLKFIVQNLVKSLPISRAIPFKNGVPGADWIRNFEKRWSKELGNRKPELLTKARAEALTHSVVNSFFNTYEDVLKENNLINSPERIFNLDEAGLGTDSRNCGVFVAKNSRTAYLNSATCGKTMYSVLFCVSADGKHMPPFTVYKSLHLYDTWTRGGPPGALYGCTDSGWMHDTIFEQWMRNFSTYVEPLQKPVLLIYDGHGSHLKYETIKHAMEKKNILCLPPNTSHALQPLDVGVFSPMKRKWKDILKLWFRESRLQSVTKAVFPFLLCKLFEDMSTVNVIKGSGIYPPNREAVAHRITVSISDVIESPQSTSKVLVANVPVAINESPSTSLQGTAILPASHKEGLASNTIIGSPYKDLKIAILSAISPKPSNFTISCIKNSNVSGFSTHIREIPEASSSVGSWVKVEYLGKKRKQEFIGKVMAIEGQTYEVKYLKKSEMGEFYVFPNADDTDFVEEKQIIDI